MPFEGERRLVEIGCGAIGAGLFVYEASRAGSYAPPLVVDVRAELVAALRTASGRLRVNIAQRDRVEVAELGPVVAADPSVAADRAAIVSAIATADELATALPSISAYVGTGPGSPHRLLADGLRARASEVPLVIYCAENHRSAASRLEAAVLDACPPADRDAVRPRARFVDTVIGKMSGVIGDPAELAARGLSTITPDLAEAFLVEAFDRILVSRVLPGGDLHPGMPVLREVDDLAPFEDAKLLGHNATHALAGFLGQLLGLRLVAQLRDAPGAMAFLRAAFVAESGAALIARHAGTDPLFTPQGYAAFADDLLARMVNPYLADTVERAARDPRRKLGWDDRLVGLLRLGLGEGVATPRYALGVAAGLDVLRTQGAHGDDAELLRAIWGDAAAPGEAAAVLEVVEDGRARLARWRRGGFEGLGMA